MYGIIFNARLFALKLVSMSTCPVYEGSADTEKC
jgi:hypothetical protein